MMIGMCDIRNTFGNNVLWVSPSVYERILNNLDSIIVESQCRPPLKLKVIGGPKKIFKNKGGVE